MNRRYFLALGASAGVAAALVPGCGPPYRYVRMGAPSPLFGARHVYLEPMRFDNLIVGNMPEGAYLAGKTPQQQASFEADKQEFANRFAAWMGANSPVPVAVGGARDPSMLALRPHVTHYEPGVFTFVYNRATEVSMVVQLVRGDGAVLEEIVTQTAVDPNQGVSMYGGARFDLAASGTRMRIAGENLGRYVATYLRRRTRGEAMLEHPTRRRA